MGPTCLSRCIVPCHNPCLLLARTTFYFTQPLRVAGVPEHFNVPWHLAAERGEFDAAGVNVSLMLHKAQTLALFLLW